jgi:cell fate (sporulation/competence/biofilm development) regulator YlbF (YheA/YmcA/DUF963 family)
MCVAFYAHLHDSLLENQTVSSLIEEETLLASTLDEVARHVVNSLITSSQKAKIVCPVIRFKKKGRA